MTSEANVELVRRVLPAPDVDIAAMFRDDDAFGSFADAIAPFFHQEFEIRQLLWGVMEENHVGVSGLRAGWLDWLAPWATYRTEIEQIIEASDRVLVLVRDFGRRDEAAPAVELISAAVWTVLEGKIARVEFFGDRASALEAVGLDA